MYLTSHHVVSPSSGQEGVNTFLYLHGPYTWTQPPPGIPDQNPGTLSAQSISVRPPGNRVRSYLDIVAPDETRWAEVRSALMEFVGMCQRSPFPWTEQSGKCSFRLGMELGIAGQWQRELAVLYRAAQALRLANAV
ncbi:MAG: hypothetical protein HYZ29_21145 [Myxococcales bacterium]|nr:hypothetical protein [Myxococcales bacterium]